MFPHCTSQPSSFSFIAKQTIASILRLLYTSQNYMMPFQTILYYYHLLYNILFFNIIGSSPFPPYCSKDQRVDQTRQAAVCLFLLLCTRTYINIYVYTQTIPAILVLFSFSLHTILQTRNASPLSLVMHPSILQQDGHWTDPHSQTAINVTQQEIRNISQDCY